MTKLKAPPGTDEANVGVERFPVGEDGTVDVPADAVESLTSVGGFTEVDEAPAPETEPSAEFAALKHPEGVGCSFAGVSYEPDDKGVVHVPHAAVADLASHGFAPVE